MKAMLNVLWLCCFTGALPAAADAAETGCEGYFYFSKAQQVESLTTDEKGRSRSRRLTTVTSVSDAPDGLRSSLQTETYDADGKLVSTATTEARCEGGDLLLDMTGGLPSQKEPTRSAQPRLLRYPAAMQVEQQLGDQVDFDLDGAAEGKAMKVNFNLADRRVAGRLEVETPTGRAQSFLITSVLNVRFKIAGVTIPMRYDLTEYFVPGLGVVSSQASQKGRVVERSTIRFLPRR